MKVRQRTITLGSPRKRGAGLTTRQKHIDFHLFSDRNNPLLALSSTVVKTEGIVKAQKFYMIILLSISIPSVTAQKC